MLQNLKKGSIVHSLTRGEWMQVFEDYTGGTTIFLYDGANVLKYDVEDVELIILGIGLSALGFTPVTPPSKYPKIYQNPRGFEVVEDRPMQYSINGVTKVYTFEVQEEYDLFTLIEKYKIIND